MNCERRMFLRQPAPFRPHLERLESRDCPSCTAGDDRISAVVATEGDVTIPVLSMSEFSAAWATTT